MSDTPTPVGGWKPPTEVVTLPSGRTAELLVSLPVWSLLRSGRMTKEQFEALEQAEQGALTDPLRAVEVTDLICETMFVEPKVSSKGAKNAVPLDHLFDEDIEFVVERAFGGTSDDSFRGERDGAVGSGDSEGVGNDPVEAAGSTGGKPRGAKSRPKAGAKAQ